MSNVKPKNANSTVDRISTVVWILVITGVLYGGCWFGVIHFIESNSDGTWTNRGQFGDMFGAVNALFSGLAFAGIIFTSEGIDSWYQTLTKPFFTPPNSFFAPVWTVLYLMMAASLYLVLRSKKAGKITAVGLFIIQLALNVLWSFLFFKLHNPLFAFVDILFLSLVIGQTIAIFSEINRAAGRILYPYLIWVIFATLLNLGVILMN